MKQSNSNRKGSNPSTEIRLERISIQKIRARGYITITDAAQVAGVRALSENVTDDWHISAENAALNIRYESLHTSGDLSGSGGESDDTEDGVAVDLTTREVGLKESNTADDGSETDQQPLDDANNGANISFLSGGEDTENDEEVEVGADANDTTEDISILSESNPTSQSDGDGGDRGDDISLLSEEYGSGVSSDQSEESTQEQPAENVAIGMVVDAPDIDGRQSREHISINCAGSAPPKHTLQIRLPNRVLNKLGVDVDDPSGERVQIFAGKNVIAFATPDVDSVSVSNLPNNDVDPVDLLGEVSSAVFREVEIERQHPAQVAVKYGKSKAQIITIIRRSRSRLKKLVDTLGVETEYDFDNPVVPEAGPRWEETEINTPHPTEEFTDGELRAEIHSRLSTYLRSTPENEYVDKIKRVVKRTGGVGTAPIVAAEAVIDELDRSELNDLYLLLELEEERKESINE